MDTSAKAPPGDLWEPVSTRVPTSQFPRRPPSAKEALGGRERPQPLERPRDAEPAGTHPTATRRQRRAGRTMSASQAAANRRSGEPGPGSAGPSCSELHSERSAELGSCGSSRKTQPTASARKPAYAEPRHSAMGTRREIFPSRLRSRPAPLPGLARADVDTRATSRRRATASPKGRGYGRREGRGVLLVPVLVVRGAVRGPEVGGTKAVVEVRALQPFPEFQSYPKIEGRGYLCFPSKTIMKWANLTLIFGPSRCPHLSCARSSSEGHDSHSRPVIRPTAPLCILPRLLNSSSIRPGAQRSPEGSAQTAAALQRPPGVHVARGFCLFGGWPDS